MAVQVHLIVDAVLAAGPTTITIRPAVGKIGKFWYAKGSSVGGSPVLTLVGETGTKQLDAGAVTFEFGEAIFVDTTNYQKAEIIIDYNNYITLSTSGGAAGTYSVYWCET